MKRLFANIIVGIVVVMSLVATSNTLLPSSTYAAGCKDTTFFVLPNWWRGLGVTSSRASGNSSATTTYCNVDLTAKGSWQSGILTIAVNIVDGLLRVSGIIAVVFIIIGGVRYITSQGESSGISAAKQTITRAVTGLVLAISSVLILNFIAGTIFKLTVNTNNYQVSQTGDRERLS